MLRALEIVCLLLLLLLQHLLTMYRAFVAAGATYDCIVIVAETRQSVHVH